MKKILLATMLMISFGAEAASPTSAPQEVMASAPKGTTLLFYTDSGNQPHADAAAVFETAPDKDGVRWRTLTIFGKKDGVFVEDVRTDKLMACSKCSQFHDDPFDPENFKVGRGHIRIDQMDGGEKPTTTTLELTRQSGAWHVIKATRRTVDVGRYNDRTRALPIPASDLVKDMDAKWDVPWYLNTLLLNHKNNAFIFLHGDLSTEAMWQTQKGRCDQQDCVILVQQRDGCISLVRDSKGKSYPGSTSNPKKEDESISDAMKACTSDGGVECEEIRTDCSRGIF